MYTLEQYTKLSEAIALGATTVKYADKEVTYRSLSEMLKLLKIMEADINPSSKATNAVSKRKVVDYGRGYEPNNLEGL